MTTRALTPRERAVLGFLATNSRGRAIIDIDRHTPGGRPGPTLVSLERRGLVIVTRGRVHVPARRRRSARITGAYITPDGLEAVLYFSTSTAGASNV